MKQNQPELDELIGYCHECGTEVGRVTERHPEFREGRNEEAQRMQEKHQNRNSGHHPVSWSTEEPEANN